MSVNTLVVDCQIFQTAAWDRGMGKYSLDLLRAFYKLDQSKYKKIVLLFSEYLNNDQVMYGEVSRSVPSAEVVELKLKSCASGSVNSTSAHNRKIIDDYLIANSLEADFLMLSAFQNPSCPAFPSVGKKYLLFYDLIPLLYHQRYKPDENYLSRLGFLLEADKILTISLTVKNDLSIHMGISDQKIVNIDGAPISRDHLQNKKPLLEIPERFILMPTGDDIRKNNVLGVKGFELYRESDPDIKLVLTSKFEENFKETLTKLSPNLIFTNNVSEEELGWLYEHSEMLLFPSEYEGLGLPVLEAIIDDKPVACSDIPVFQEMSNTAFYYFDPRDAQSIAYALTSAKNKDNWKEKYSEYSRLIKKYSWINSARALNGAFSENIDMPSKNSKPRVAILAPSQSGYSAIGKVVAEMHPTLSEVFEIDYFFEEVSSARQLRPDYLQNISNSYKAHDFNAKRYREYDAVIYHIGNSEYHIEAIKNALFLPGYVILHDTFLDSIFGEMQKYGHISSQRNQAEDAMNSIFNAEHSKHIVSIANSQLGIVVHSDYAKSAVEEVLAEDVYVYRSDLPVATPQYNVQDHYRGTVRIGLAGILTARKGLDIIENIAKEFENCIVEIFGFSYGKNPLLKDLLKYKNITVNTNLSDLEYQSKLEKLDILINYRHDYRGETSLTALEAMRYGVVVLVRDIGWFGELPVGAVAKVNNDQDIIEKLRELISNRELRKAISAKAQDYTSRQHTSLMYAALLLKATVNQKKSTKNYCIKDALLLEESSSELKNRVRKLIAD